MSKPYILDLFCGAGGAAMGYHRAGFEVVGVDHKPQRHYPFEFIQGDALDFAALHGWHFDAIHASPPCQVHSVATPDKSLHLDLIPATRFILESLGLPYVIENVIGARRALRNPVMLCGADFGLKVYRHRLFESNILLMTCPHQPHRDNTPRAGRGASSKGFISVVGNGGVKKSPAGVKFLDYIRMAMGIDWMSRDELAQAIPPAFTEYIGRQLLTHIENQRSDYASEVGTGNDAAVPHSGVSLLCDG